MTRLFRYLARNASKEVVKGEILAPDEQSAKIALEAQGLEIQSILAKSYVSSIPANAGSAPDPLAAAFSSPSTRKIIAPLSIGLAGVFLILVLFPVVRSGYESAIVDRDIGFKVLKTADLTEDDGPVRKDFFTAVPRRVNKLEINFIAKKILAQHRERVGRIDQAMFHFYFGEQDVKTQNPVAVLRWNWDKSGSWEESFSFPQANTNERLVVEKVDFVEKEYVQYKAVVSASVSLDGARQIADKEFNRLEEQWNGKVPTIKLDLIYENFDRPFMRCQKTDNGLMDKGKGSCDFLQ